MQTLDGWNLQGVEYDASVVLSELTTNALLHAGTDVGVTISYEDRVLTLEVTDGSPKLPMRRLPNPRAATGKGLVLVEALATEWGIRQEPAGKTIWASFADAAMPEPSPPAIRRLLPQGRAQGAGGRTRREGSVSRARTVS